MTDNTHPYNFARGMIFSSVLLFCIGCSDNATVASLDCGARRRIHITKSRACDRSGEMYITVDAGGKNVLKRHMFMYYDCALSNDSNISYEALWSKRSSIVGVIRREHTGLQNGSGESDGAHIVRFMYDFSTGSVWPDTNIENDSKIHKTLLQQIQKQHADIALK